MVEQAANVFRFAERRNHERQLFLIVVHAARLRLSQ